MESFVSGCGIQSDTQRHHLSNSQKRALNLSIQAATWPNKLTRVQSHWAAHSGPNCAIPPVPLNFSLTTVLPLARRAVFTNGKNTIGASWCPSRCSHDHQTRLTNKGSTHSLLTIAACATWNIKEHHKSKLDFAMCVFGRVRNLWEKYKEPDTFQRMTNFPKDAVAPYIECETEDHWKAHISLLIKMRDRGLLQPIHLTRYQNRPNKSLHQLLNEHAPPCEQSRKSAQSNNPSCNNNTGPAQFVLNKAREYVYTCI